MFIEQIIYSMKCSSSHGPNVVSFDCAELSMETSYCLITVDPAHNLQTVYKFISRTLLPLLTLQEDSREISAMLNLLGQRAREENPEAIDDLATNLHSDLPQTANLLTCYATEAEASKEGKRRRFMTKRNRSSYWIRTARRTIQ